MCKFELICNVDVPIFIDFFIDEFCCKVLNCYKYDSLCGRKFVVVWPTIDILLMSKFLHVKY